MSAVGHAWTPRDEWRMDDRRAMAAARGLPAAPTTDPEIIGDRLDEIRESIPMEDPEMNENQYKALTALLGLIHDELTEQRHLLQALAAASGRGPRFTRPLAAFGDSNWPEEIGAEIVDEDDDGPAVVRYAGHLWKRRSGSGNYGDAVWYSRPHGLGEDGKARYLRLITFKDYDDVYPVDDHVAKKANGGSRQAPAPTEAMHAENADALGADVDTAENSEPREKQRKQAVAQAKAAAQRAPAQASADDIIYTYGNGEDVADLDNESEIAAFDAYAAAHGGKPPHDKASLRNWYAARAGEEE